MSCPKNLLDNTATFSFGALDRTRWHLVNSFEFNLQIHPPGWHVGNDSPTTVSTAYRWITDAVLNQSRSRSWKEAERYTLFPVEVQPSIVMTYSVHKNGAGLSRESQDIMVPGDYGLNTIGKNTFFAPLRAECR